MRYGNVGLCRFFILLVSFAVASGLFSSPLLSAKKKEQGKERSLREETSDRFLKKWLEQDVAYIITKEERAAFKQMTTDEERYEFIEQFWLRRDPNPDTLANENREEHYRRIAYANERFSSGKPGWKTDRGRIYIMFGPPDSIDSEHGGGEIIRPFREGGGRSVTHPFIKWRYRHLEGPDLGNEVIIEFVDSTLSGEYRMAWDPYEKDALKMTPFYDLTEMEQLGLGTPNSALRSGILIEEFKRLQGRKILQHAVLGRAPRIKFKDLETVVDTKLSYNLFPFEFRTDYFRITDDTVMAAVTVKMQNRDMTFESSDGVQKATVNIFGRITTLTGRRVHTFEQVVSQSAPESLFKSTLERASMYQTSAPLRSGLYKLELVLKDLKSGNVGTSYRGFRVPKFPEDRLSTSSIILADRIERIPMNQATSGQFIIGGSKVLPNVTETFHRSTPMGIYIQIYNLALDEATKKPSATIEYILKKGDQTLRQYREGKNQFAGPSQQLTLQKLFPLNNLEPGQYSLVINVVDNLAKRSVSPETEFTVQ